MKRSKPTNFGTNSSPQLPREINSRAQLRDLQRTMANALFRPLNSQWGMQTRWIDGSSMEAVASELSSRTIASARLSDWKFIIANIGSGPSIASMTITLGCARSLGSGGS